MHADALVVRRESRVVAGRGLQSKAHWGSKDIGVDGDGRAGVFVVAVVVRTGRRLRW